MVRPVHIVVGALLADTEAVYTWDESYRATRRPVERSQTLICDAHVFSALERKRAQTGLAAP